MIFKKPYAFLIKNFRLIHIALLIIITYITYKFSRLVSFFSGYVINSNIVSETAASQYISGIMILAVFLIIAFAASMCLLMQNKRKPSLFYLLAVVYYIIVLFALFHARSLINMLVDTTLTQQVSRAYNDIYKIIFVPNIYFIVITFIRAIGFDVKKFNFNKDLQELEIKREDDEEVEFILGNENFKYQRKIRRIIREFKYYFAENKIFIAIISSSLIIIGAVAIILNVTFFNHVYTLGETFNASNFTYTLNNVYLTKMDYNGKLIKNDKSYLLLDFTINSKGGASSIKPENFYLMDGKKVYYYKSTLASSFFDLGTAYTNNKIDANKSNYIFIFEIEGKVKNKYILNIFDKITYKDKKANYEFKTYKITPTLIDKEPEKTNINLGESITINKDYFPETSFMIKSYKIVNSYVHKVEKCNEDKSDCKTETKTILPNDINNNNLLVVEYDLSLDNKTKNLFKPEDYFFNRFLVINSTVNNKKFDIKGSYKKISSNNILLLDIPKNVKTNEIRLTIETRENNIQIGK